MWNTEYSIDLGHYYFLCQIGVKFQARHTHTHSSSLDSLMRAPGVAMSFIFFPNMVDANFIRDQSLINYLLYSNNALPRRQEKSEQ